MTCFYVTAIVFFSTGTSQLDSKVKDGYHHQTVRGVFVEGEPAYEGAGIYTKTHIQIAVGDSSCILGYFLPCPLYKEDKDHG